MIKVRLGDSPIEVQESRWFRKVSAALFNLEGQQLGYITLIITNHDHWYNEACEVHLFGNVRGRVDVDIYDGKLCTDYLIKHALEQAGLELEQP